ncbi:MAG: ABC transporter permease [Actinobacteria bacterium]|nr:MAG: ABC transporter permease [Actinomycetota bacterium]
MTSIEADVAFAPEAARVQAVAASGTRGRRQHPLTQIRRPLSGSWRAVLGAVGVSSLVVLWLVAASSTNLVPTPLATWHAFTRLWRDGVFLDDVRASSQRIAIGYGISVVLGVVFGIAMGTFASAEAFFEPQFGFLRYIPASALTPVMLLWLGIGESPKITMIVIGTVFFNILMIADVARLVPRELLNASYTLGATRWTVLRRVVFRHSLPGIVDVARVNLAAAWLMLVVSEVLAANEGLAYRIVRAQRFRGFDTMFAVLIVFGIIGLISDLFLRWLRNAIAPWARP